MLVSGAPVGMRPVNVAPVMVVGPVSAKSSAASISRLPPNAGREAIAIRPSGEPLEKVKGAPEAGTEAIAARATPSTIESRVLRFVVMDDLHKFDIGKQADSVLRPASVTPRRGRAVSSVEARARR